MKGISNAMDTRMILQHIEEERDREFHRAYGAVSRLHRTDITCSGFMGSNPNDQIHFAAENGLFVGNETD